jgi:endonuclease YncB( thermonuclease family)
LARRRKSCYAWSRRTRAALVGICLTGAALLVALDRGFVAPQWSRPAASRGQAFAVDFAQYHGRSFPVAHAVDGDTLHLGVPDASGPVTKVRLIGIDTPELGNGGREPMYFGPEAAAFAKRLALGKTVTVYLDERAGSRDRYDRLLAYLALPDGRFLNEELLLEGYAYADLRFRHGYYQKYQQLEASARALQKGLWARVTPEQMPPWRQRRLSSDAAVD